MYKVYRRGSGKGGARPGAGAPKKAKANHSRHRAISMTAVDWAEMQARAKQSGLSVSEYIRRRTLDDR